MLENSRMAKTAIMVTIFALGAISGFVGNEHLGSDPVRGETHTLVNPEAFEIGNLVRSSDTVVRGNVTGVGEGRWDTEDGERPENLRNAEIYHFVNVSVEETLKDKAEDEITIRVRGGMADGITMQVDRAPQFYEGDRVILPLNEEGEYYTVAGEKFGALEQTSEGLIRRDVPPRYREISITDLQAALNLSNKS